MVRSIRIQARVWEILAILRAFTGLDSRRELGRGFTSNGREGTVSVFDIKSLATTSKVKVGENPDDIFTTLPPTCFHIDGKSHQYERNRCGERKIMIGTVPPMASRVRGQRWKAVVFVNIEDKSELKSSIRTRWKSERGGRSHRARSPVD